MGFSNIDGSNVTLRDMSLVWVLDPPSFPYANVNGTLNLNPYDS